MNSIHATAPSARHLDQTFEAILAEQVKKAPWLGLSLLFHGAVVLVLTMLPPPQRATERSTLSLAPKASAVADEELPPPPPEPKEQQAPTEPTIADAVTDVTVEPVTGEVTGADDGDRDGTGLESAFNGTGWNVGLGLGHGAAGHGNGRLARRRGAPASARPSIECVDAGLRWLARHQDEDGKWDADEFMKHDRDGAPCTGAGNPVHDVGVTGLALLAFLGDGNTLAIGPYKDNVKRAVLWLKEQQQESGLIGQPTSHDFVYDHAIATLAICEAFGLSHYKSLRPCAQSAISYLEQHRNPYRVWRYQPRDGDNDASVTGWCVMTYKSALDFGLAVDRSALKTALVFFDELTDPATGRCGYTRRGEPSSRHPGDHATRFPPARGEAMTAVGLLSRIFLGQDPKQERVMPLAASALLAKPPRWANDGSIDHYYWYYATYALWQMGGQPWRDWSRALDAAVVKTQRKDGNHLGSWDPLCVWGEDGGRVYSTAILVLTLEAYYRYAKVIAR